VNRDWKDITVRKPQLTVFIYWISLIIMQENPRDIAPEAIFKVSNEGMKK
jgi:hypothetical protein